MNLTSIFQKIIYLQYGIENSKFKKSLLNLEQSQREGLKSLLNYLRPYQEKLNNISSYEDFRMQVPISHYSDWKSEVESMRVNPNHPFRRVCHRFEPTSGSTNSIKWIPYSKRFLGEINKAAAAWLYDTFTQYPDVLKGRHYWSLSWIPPEMRGTHNSNDVELFPFWQRCLLSKIMAVPDHVKFAKTKESCWFASLVYLVACEDLSLISIWSPTFLIQMINDILKYKLEIASTLQRGEWTLFNNELADTVCPQSHLQANKLKLFNKISNPEQFKSLWPQLSLISSWDSSTAEAWVPELKKIFPHVPIQGKGLWATEGIVTFPYQGKKVLSLRSHFYEFRCLETDRIFPSWGLQVGMSVQPIITSGSGLLRYELPDKMKVVDFIGTTPCLNFINRINSIDLVGEKIDFDTAHGIIQETNQHFGVRGLCLIAEKRALPKPKYKLLLEEDINTTESYREVIEKYIESKLCNHYHYQLSRSLGQLGPCEILTVKDSLSVLKGFQKASIGGGNKIEPIVVLE